MAPKTKAKGGTELGSLSERPSLLSLPSQRPAKHANAALIHLPPAGTGGKNVSKFLPFPPLAGDLGRLSSWSLPIRCHRGRLAGMLTLFERRPGLRTMRLGHRFAERLRWLLVKRYNLLNGLIM